MAKKKDCWEWISSKIQQTEGKLKSRRINLTFFVYKDGKVTYCIGIAPNQDYPVRFKAYQILACIEKAEESGLTCSVEEQFDDNPVMIIYFRKEI